MALAMVVGFTSKLYKMKCEANLLAIQSHVLILIVSVKDLLFFAVFLTTEAGRMYYEMKCNW